MLSPSTSFVLTSKRTCHVLSRWSLLAVTMFNSSTEPAIRRLLMATARTAAACACGMRRVEVLTIEYGPADCDEDANRVKARALSSPPVMSRYSCDPLSCDSRLQSTSWAHIMAFWWVLSECCGLVGVCMTSSPRFEAEEEMSKFQNEMKPSVPAVMMGNGS